MVYLLLEAQLPVGRVVHGLSRGDFMKRFLILLAFIFLFPCIAHGATLYVAASGGGGTTCSSESPCTLAYANSNAAAGDTVILQDGIYTDGEINPTNSGTLVGTTCTAKITYQAANKGLAVITGTPANNYGIFLHEKVCIKIDGVKVQDSGRWASLEHSSTHNEVTNCTFTNVTNPSTLSFYVWDYCSSGVYGCHSTHNWIHGNTFSNVGRLCYDNTDPKTACSGASYSEGAGCLYIGNYSGTASGQEYVDDNNTIENNDMYQCGHHVLETNTRYNVIRNNRHQNAAWKTTNETGETLPYGASANGKWGNRTWSIYDPLTRAEGTWNLIENNRVGYGSSPGTDNGAENIALVSSYNILRFNYIFKADGDGIWFKDGVADNNVVYNNTLFNNGQFAGDCTGGCVTSPIRTREMTFHLNSIGNTIKNNLISTNAASGIFGCVGTGCSLDDQTISNNFCSSAGTGCSASGDPGFVSTDVTDPTSATLPNFMPTNTAVRRSAAALTTVHADDTSSGTDLIVANALFFQDGTWGSDLTRAAGTMNADWICVGTSSNCVQISSINYATNTLTLSSAISRSDGDNVWLYKDSTGTVRLYGAAPDYGAYTFTGNASVGTGAGFSLGTGAAITIQ